MPVALLRCLDLPEPDIDEAPLIAALADLGIDAATPSWDDPAFDPNTWDVCVLRATWNYAQHPEAFLAFVDRVGAHGKLWNPPAAVRANIDKRYLRELESAGIPIVPTFWVEPGEADRFDVQVREHQWTDIVIKPAVSAGSFLTKRFAASAFDQAEAFLRGCLDGTAAPDGRARTMMVQRYMPAVETVGERSLVWIDGSFTHAVHKHPRFDDQDEFVEDTELTQDLIEFGEQVMRHAPEGCRYARVDVIPDDAASDGSWVLTELELIEPSLFLVYDNSGKAASQMAKLIQREVQETRALS